MRQVLTVSNPKGALMSKPLDTTLSLEIAKQINSKRNNSFDNAYKAALLMEGATYVQGFLVRNIRPYVPIEHSWIELEESLVDPTSLRQEENIPELYYFPAQRLSVKKLKAAIEEAKEDYPDDPPLPVYGAAPYEYYGDLMLGGEDYQGAYNAALAKCKELQNTNH
jgi:hypothetical protein